MAQEKFLIDANVFVTPYRQYYPFDLAPSFWERLEELIKDGTIVVMDMVKAEILQGTDDLSTWMGSLEIGDFLDRRQPEIIAKYTEVLTHLQTSPCYQEAALHEWSRATVADPWLIAAAAAKGYTIITLETSNKNLSPTNPVKRPKIPDVSRALGVDAQNLFYLMRKLNFRL